MSQEFNSDDTPKTNAMLVAKVNKAIQNTQLETFFSPNSNFIKELADKAAALANDPDTPICGRELLLKTAQVTMHQLALFCDDGASMERENRWDSQNELIKRIARVTTRILPEGEGIYLRYINQKIPNPRRLKFEELVKLVDEIKLRGVDGGTSIITDPIETFAASRISTNLKSQVLEPLVYSKLPDNLLRPLLVFVITDEMPRLEPNSAFLRAIAECGDELAAAGLPRESVNFIIGQVGSAPAIFPQDIGKVSMIENVVFVASGKLDDAFSKLKSDWEIDKWLIKTLSAPIMKIQTRNLNAKAKARVRWLSKKSRERLKGE